MQNSPDLIKNDPIKLDSSTKLKIKNHLLNYGTMRYSVDSVNSNMYKIDSV